MLSSQDRAVRRFLARWQDTSHVLTVVESVVPIWLTFVIIGGDLETLGRKRAASYCSSCGVSCIVPVQRSVRRVILLYFCLAFH